MTSPVHLTAEQVKLLQDMEAQVKFWRREIDRAKRAGLDTTEHEANLAEADRRRRALLSVYGPQRRGESQ